MKKHLNASIGFFGFQEAPQDLARRLKIDVDQFRQKGEIPEGGRIAAKENAIIVYSSNPEEDELDLHVKDILDRIPSEIDVEGMEACLQVTVYIKENDYTPVSAICLEPVTVGRLFKLGCSIDVDIYAYKNTNG